MILGKPLTHVGWNQEQRVSIHRDITLGHSVKFLALAANASMRSPGGANNPS